ncbi:MAG: hypothetical protein WC341_07040 [Bacteroidales bacterium]
MRYLYKWLLTMCLFLSMGTCWGGWVISETITDNFGNKSSRSTFIQQNLIRFEDASSITILNLNDSSITIVFSTLRAYWQGSPAELIEGMIDAFDVQAQTLILDLPYDQQPIYQQMYDSIKQQLKSPDTQVGSNQLKLIKLDSLAFIGEYKAGAYQIITDSTLKEEFWVTQEVKPYSEVDIPLFISINNRINPYSRKGYTLDSEEYIRLLSEGLIVKSTKPGENGHFIETQLKSVKQFQIPVDFFYPPVNYRKVSLVDVLNLPVIDPEEGQDK